ncbi:hypothetical protein FA09DRAFT_255909 [Tilletiopsis washingtonensis]|uniref:Uncharacterized protein n=1 Tax=Tilletiopsis washingtonensis TaxID=58919 RepID=A0A316ZCS3_9BASI|nr:hypothetical protein FA09DRAFT_255909 [Tilletiopsis washingtonensis]PWN98848.1 hypothetical protein FA09DRAFT_255909 [Tilletiopsis washingtonensis]
MLLEQEMWVRVLPAALRRVLFWQPARSRRAQRCDCGPTFDAQTQQADVQGLHARPGQGPGGQQRPAAASDAHSAPNSASDSAAPERTTLEASLRLDCVSSSGCERCAEAEHVTSVTAQLCRAGRLSTLAKASPSGMLCASSRGSSRSSEASCAWRDDGAASLLRGTAGPTPSVRGFPRTRGCTAPGVRRGGAGSGMRWTHSGGAEPTLPRACSCRSTRLASSDVRVRTPLCVLGEESSRS